MRSLSRAWSMARLARYTLARGAGDAVRSRPRENPFPNFLDRLEDRLTPTSGLAALLSPVTAGNQAVAEVAAGPRLASIDTAQSALLNGLLTSLAGSNTGLSLAAADYNGLAAGGVNLGGLLTHLQGVLNVATPEAVLTTNATLGQIMTAAAAVAQADGNTALANVFNAAVPAVGPLAGGVKLGELFHVTLPTGSLAQAQVSALDLLVGGVQLFNFRNVASTSLRSVAGANLGALGSVLNGVDLRAQVVEPPVFVIGPQGTQFSSAAVRLKLDVDLVDVTLNTSSLLGPILGILDPLNLGTTSVTASASVGRVQLFADVARGSGTIQAIDALANAVTLRATPSVADLYLGTISDALFDNRARVINPATDLTAGVVGELDIDATVAGISILDLDLGLTLRAFAEGVAAGQVDVVFGPTFPDFQTVGSSTTAVGNLLTSLIGNLQLGATGNLGVLSGLLNTVTGTLRGVAGTVLQPVLNTLLTGLADPALNTLGVGIGELDLAVLGMDTPGPDTVVAADDTVNAIQNQAVVTNVRANDTIPAGVAVTTGVGAVPLHGSAVVNGDGSITYTPDAGYVGGDTFSYTLTDQYGRSATGTVTVAVRQLNANPIVVGNTATATAGLPTVINVLGNDTDADGHTLGVASVTQPANGTVVINGDGTITYTPDAGFSGVDSFTYTASDGNGGTGTATVYVTVTGGGSNGGGNGGGSTNLPPAATPDLVNTTAGQPTTINVLGNDNDPDGGTLALVSVTQPGNGAVVINGNGTVTYTPTPGYVGPDSFTYTVADGQGGTTTQTVVVSIAPANGGGGGGGVTNQPPAVYPDAASVVAGQPTVINVLGNDLDVDGNPLTVVSVTQPANGTVVINGDGTLTYTPTPGYSGTDTFTYTASDGNGEARTTTVTVTVAAGNSGGSGGGTANLPPAGSPDAVSVVAGQPTVINVLGNDTDPDGGTLAVSSVTQPVHGTVVINSDGTLTYSPATGFTGVDSFTYTVTDGQGGTTTVTVAVAVAADNSGGGGGGANQPPVVSPDAVNTTAGQPVVVNVLGNDTDPNGGTLTVTTVTQPTHGTVVLNGDGTITYTSAAGFNGIDSFTYTVSNGNGGAGTATVAVAVGGANQPPVPLPDAVQAVPGQPTVINVLANDTDPDGGTLTLVSVTQPGHGSVVINPDGTLSYTPWVKYRGADSFSYTVADRHGVTRTTTVTVTVVPRKNDELVNPAPVVSPDVPSGATGGGETGPAIPGVKMYAVGAGVGGGPHVTVYNPDGSVRFNFFAYDPAARFGVNVSLCDVDRDGVPDIITTPGAGGSAHVKVFSGKDLSLLASFIAFDPVVYRGGATTTGGDVNGDGWADVVVAAGDGGPRVQVFDGSPPGRGTILANRFAFDTKFNGWVSVATADLDGDGKDELITGAGPGGPPLVRVWDVTTSRMLSEFYAFGPDAKGGVNVGGHGNYLVVGAGVGELPVVRVFRGPGHKRVTEHLAYDPSFRGGVRVSGMQTVDPSDSLFVLGPGVGGGPHVRVVDPVMDAVIPDYYAYASSFRGGVKVV